MSRSNTHTHFLQTSHCLTRSTSPGVPIEITATSPRSVSPVLLRLYSWQSLNAFINTGRTDISMGRLFPRAISLQPIITANHLGSSMSAWTGQRNICCLGRQAKKDFYTERWANCGWGREEGGCNVNRYERLFRKQHTGEGFLPGSRCPEVFLIFRASAEFLSALGNAQGHYDKSPRSYIWSAIKEILELCCF